MAKFAVVLAAAGKSSRFQDTHYKKPFAPLKDRAVWLHSAEKFLARDDVSQVIVVIDPEDREEFQARFGPNVAILGIVVVEGGTQRADSVANGLARVASDVDFVAVHDAARPCLAEAWIEILLVAFHDGIARTAGIPGVVHIEARISIEGRDLGWMHRTEGKDDVQQRIQVQFA